MDEERCYCMQSRIETTNRYSCLLHIAATILLSCRISFAGDTVVIAQGTDTAPAAELAESAAARFTVCGWVQPAEFANEERVVVERALWVPELTGEARTCRLNYRLGMSADGLPYVGYHQPGYGAVFVKAAATNSLKAGAWVHLAGSYDGDGLRLYVNGKMVSAVRSLFRPIKDTPEGENAVIAVGGHAAEPGKDSTDLRLRCVGLLDEVCIWNTALADQDIVKTMTTPSEASTTNLVAHWTFDTGSAKGISGNCTEIK